MRQHNFFLLLLLLVLATSCMSVKDVTYFQDLQDAQSLKESYSATYEYKVKPGDNLYIDIKTLDEKVNELFKPSSAGTGAMSSTQYMYGSPVAQSINGYQLDSIGAVKLPILGSVIVAGKTVAQVENVIVESASIYLKNPIVKVKLLNFKFNVSGEVNNPGIFYNYEGKLNVMDALSMAGGITKNAKLQKTFVLRQEEEGAQTYLLDLTNTETYSSEAFYLHPSDAIYVQPGRNKKIDMNTHIYQLFITTISTVLGLQILYQDWRL